MTDRTDSSAMTDILARMAQTDAALAQGIAQRLHWAISAS